MTVAPDLRRPRFMTAATATTAAGQAVLFAVLAGISAFAVVLEAGPSWWWGLALWTALTAASGATWWRLVRGQSAERGRLPYSSWAFGMVLCLTAAVCGLAVLVSTHSPVALVVVVLGLAGAGFVSVGAPVRARPSRG